MNKKRLSKAGEEPLGMVRLLLWFLGIASIFLCANPCFADGLAVPAKARIELIDLKTVRLTRTVDLKGQGIPILAAHPLSPIMACVQPSAGLIFWNTPSFAQASQAKDPLFDDVTAIVFSQEGDRLFLLHASLRAILVFDLKSSTITGTWAIPGGAPQTLDVSGQTLVIGQKDGLTLLEASNGLLLGQWRLESPPTGSLLTDGQLTFALKGQPGLLRYQAQSGQRLTPPIGDGTYGSLLSITSHGTLAMNLLNSHLELRSNQDQLIWSTPVSSGDQDLYQSSDGLWVYALGRESRSLSVIEVATGRELGRLPLAEVGGKAAFYRGETQ